MDNVNNLNGVSNFGHGDAEVPQSDIAVPETTDAVEVPEVVETQEEVTE